MGMKKRITVNAKITEEESAKLNAFAERENISITALIRLLVDGLLNGDIEVEKGEIKSCPTHDEYCISDEDFEENLKFKEYRMDKLLNTFQELGYPDYLIRQSVETMICQLKETGKYSARRSNTDWGC